MNSLVEVDDPLGRLFVFGSFPGPAAAVDVEDYEEGNQGDKAVADGAGDGQELVPVLAEDVADGGGEEGPGSRGGEAVGEEVMVLHPADPGEEGGHAPQARTEAPHEDRFAPVLLEVALDLAEASGVEEQGEEACLQDLGQEWASSDAPDPIHCVVRDVRAQKPDEHNHRQGDMAVVGKEATGEHH